MRAVAGRLEVKPALRRRAPDRRRLQRQSGLAAGRACARWRSVPGERWLVLGEMAELGDGGPAAARRDGRARARVRRDAPARRWAPARGPRWRRSAPARPGTRTPTTLIAALRAELRAGVTVLRQGLAREPARARRRRACQRRRAPRREATDAASRRRLAGRVLLRLQRLPLPDAARDPRGAHGARDLAAGRPDDDPLARRVPGRPARALRRAADAPEQGRHADDGRRADPRRDRRSRRCCGPTSPTASSGSCCWSRSPSA